MDEFEAQVKEVDTGEKVQKNLEVVFYLLSASEEKSESVFPPKLSKVVKQLEDTFQYGGYSLVETASVRTRVGSSLEHMSGIPLSKLNIEKERFSKAHYKVNLGRIEEKSTDKYSLDVTLGVTLEARREEKIKAGDGFRSTIKLNPVGMSLHSAIDIKDQQSVVLGKSNFDNTNDALFIVMQIREAL